MKKSCEHWRSEPRVQVHIWSIPGKEVPPEDDAALRDALATRSSVLREISQSTLHAYGTLNDIYGKPALLVRADIERAVSAQGAVAARVASASSIAGSLVVAAAIWFLLQSLIVRPLQHVTAHAERIGRTDDLKARLSLDRSDEIGSLARELDAMVEQLADSRKKMLDVAHQAGMAEIASEVLHNVGNVVNSAGVSAELLEQRLHHSKIEGLERAACLVQEQRPRLAEFFAQDPRGPKVIEYLGQLAQVLRDERQANLADVQRMRETIRHIRDVVALQQSYAGHGDFQQLVGVTELLEDVVRMNNKEIIANDIVVERHYEPVPEIELNKNKLLQVLVNLVKNAVQALRDHPSDDRRLILAVRRSSPQELLIEIRDTGVGIDVSHQTKIFNHGFTTKPDGHGFGLHFSANAVKEMGGTILVESEGLGRGAKFRVSVPVESPVTAA